MNNIGRTIFRLWGWLGVLLYLVLAVQMARLLVSPGPDDGVIILTFGVMMAFEFILVHSGVFMALMPRKISLVLLVPGYGLFALAFNAGLPGNAILWLYMAVVLPGCGSPVPSHRRKLEAPMCYSQSLP